MLSRQLAGMAADSGKESSFGTLAADRAGVLKVLLEPASRACVNCIGGCGLQRSAPRAVGCASLLPAGARSGDRVRFVLDPGSLLYLAGLCFLFPALLAFLGAVSLAFLLPGMADAAAVGGSALGLAVGAAVLRLYDSHGGGRYWLSRVRVTLQKPA